MKRIGFLIKNKGLCRLAAVLLCLTLIMTVLPAANVNNTLDEGSAPLATLFFGSDYQEESGWDDPSVTLTSILTTVKNAGKEIDHAVFCGDFTNNGYYNYNADASSDIAEIGGIVDNILGSDTIDTYFQGNHDKYDSSLMTATGAYEYDSYILYVINTQDGNPWLQGNTGAENTVKATAAKLTEYLNGLIDTEDTRPVFIATHVPLHMTSRTSSNYDTSNGDNMYSSHLFNAINEAAKKLDIVFLYGHNHSHGWDSYIGGSSVYLAKGQTIYIPDSTNVTTAYTNKYTAEALNFTYMNAGYLGYNTNTNTSGGADNTLTGTVVDVYADRLEITRYDSSGIHKLGSKGAYNSASDSTSYNDANGFGGNNNPYTCVSADTPSPQTVERENEFDGKLLRILNKESNVSLADSTALTADFMGLDDNEAVEYTWQSSDTSVVRLKSSETATAKSARASDDGTVTGETVTAEYMGVGTAEITLTAESGDLTRSTSYSVIVTAEGSSSGNVYTLVTSTNNLTGDGYLIVYKDDGKIVQPEIRTSDSRTGLIADSVTAFSGSVPNEITGSYSSYEWKFAKGSYTYGDKRLTTFNYWTIQKSSDSKYLKFDDSSSNNYKASLNNSDNSYFSISISNKVATFSYKNSQNNSSQFNYRMQKSTSRGIVYGYDSGATTTSFYIYKKTGSSTATPSLKIVTKDGSEIASQYDATTSEVFKAQTENISQITSVAWSSSDSGVIDFSDSTANTPTVNFLKAGTATVACTVTYVDSSGSTKTITTQKSITVNAYSNDPTADIVRNGNVITNIMQRRYSVKSTDTDSLTADYADINNPTVTWSSSNTDIAEIDNNGNITFKGKTGYTNITLKVSGTDINGKSVTLTRTVPYYTSTDKSSSSNNDYPSYPDEGAVNIDKYATSEDFHSTGVAQVKLNVDGISNIVPLDIVIVLDMSSSMKTNKITENGVEKSRTVVMNESLSGLVQDLLAENPDGTANENRLSFVAFNNYDYTQIDGDNNIGYSYASKESKEGFNIKSGGENPILSGSRTENDSWVSNLNTVNGLINTYITDSYNDSGTNYDIALMTAYNILAAAKEEENYSREQVVLFMSDGCPFQWNYFRGYSHNDSTDYPNRATAWINWLGGTYNNSNYSYMRNNTYVEEYYTTGLDDDGNPEGKNLWAEAIKSTSDSNKVIDPYNGKSADKYIKYVDGLGATIYSLGYCLADDADITVDVQKKVLTSVATNSSYVYYANTGSDLDDVFKKIATSLAYAATETVVTDVMGSEYDLQLASTVTTSDGTVHNINPYIEFGYYTLDSSRNNNGYTSVERVTFTTDENGKLTAATSNLKEGNIYDSSTGILTAENFSYNFNTETFTWKIGTVYDDTRYELSYFVYLTDSLEGNRDAGSYATNKSAVIDYVNWLGHKAQQTFPVPYMPWKAANVTYELYLVNEDGQPINEQGVVVDFANRIVYYRHTETVYLNSGAEETAKEIVAKNVIPDGYGLYSEDTAYYVYIGSGSNESYAYVNDTEAIQTTWVYRPDGAVYDSSSDKTGYNYKLGGINDYTNTYVAFAVVNTPDFTERRVLKVWDDGNDTAEKRPDSVTVRLLANGEEYGNPITLNESNGWTYTWNYLVKYVYENGGATDKEVEYTVEEVNPPDGYTAKYVEAADSETGLITWTVTNTYTANKYTLKIIKINNDEQYLQGAGFKLCTDEECKNECQPEADFVTVSSDDYLTDVQGELVFTGLSPGAYYINEFRAPSGYQKLSEPVKLVIGTDGTVTANGVEVDGVEDNLISLTLTNSKLNVDLPFTAGLGAYGYIALGLLLMTVGVITFTLLPKKKKEED